MARVTLVELDLAGQPLRLSVDGRHHAAYRPDGKMDSFVPGLLALDSLPARASPVFGGAGEEGISLTLTGKEAYDLWANRKTVPPQLVTGKVYWWPEGEVLRDEHEVFRGVLRDEQFVIGRAPGTSFSGVVGTGSISFTLQPAKTKIDAPFPPTGIGDEGRFPDAPDEAKPHAMPVVYGFVRGMPLYAADQAAGLAPVRLILAGHSVSSTVINVMREGIAVGPAQGPQEARDGLGALYSYVEVDGAEYEAGNAFYAAELEGWPGAHGQTVDRLGEVIEHMVLTYAGSAWATEVDKRRSTAARVNLNRLRVGMYANERQNGTLMEFLTSRLGAQFPVAFSRNGGRFGWDSMLLPERNAPADRVREGHDVYDRTGPSAVMNADDLLARVEMSYALSGYAAGSTASMNMNETNNGSVRRATSRWGATTKQELDLPDVPDASTAYSVLADVAVKGTQMRWRVEYAQAPERLWALPALSVVYVTDEELGWSDEPCYLEAARPRVDGLGVQAVFVTVEGL